MVRNNRLPTWLERTHNVQQPLVPDGLRERGEDEVAGESAVDASMSSGRNVQVTPRSSVGSEDSSNQQQSSNNPSTSPTPTTPETELSDNNPGPHPSTPILSPPGQPRTRHAAPPDPARPVLPPAPRPAKRPLAATHPSPEAPPRRVHPPPVRGNTWTSSDAAIAGLDRLATLSRELEGVAGPSSRRYGLGLPCERETTGRVCRAWMECAECDRIYVQGVRARVFVRESESECEESESTDASITDEELTDIDNDCALAAARDEDEQAAGAYGDAGFGAGNRGGKRLSPRRSRAPRWWTGTQKGG